MNKIRAHYELKYEKYHEYLIFALIPLILVGIYKNGLHLYLKNLVTILYILKPIIIIFFGILVSFLLNKIFKTKEFFQLTFYNILISLCLSININIYVYLIGIIILDIIYLKWLKKIPISFVSLSVILISIVSYLIKSYTFLNHYESININSYNFLDFLIGRSTGGIGTTSIILIIAALIYLINQKYYKSDIALSSLIIYFICGCWALLLSYTFKESMMMLCCYSCVFAFVFIAPINYQSPKKSIERYIYSALISIFTFVFIYIFKIELGVFISILIVNIIFFIKKLIKKEGN